MLYGRIHVVVCIGYTVSKYITPVSAECTNDSTALIGVAQYFFFLLLSLFSVYTIIAIYIYI